MSQISRRDSLKVLSALAAGLGWGRRADARAEQPHNGKPPLKDFLGLNVHTVLFKPELYRPVTKLLRDYHPFGWDAGEETAVLPPFPMAKNGVDWGTLYRDWTKAGYRVDVSLMFDEILPPKWNNLPADALAYGEAFAKEFGPSGPRATVESIEIGNEPGKYSDADYRVLLEAAAKGIRRGDPKLLIATCAVDAAASGEYHKSLETIKGLEDLYDVISIHSYPEAAGWPTWRRSYPEDPSLDFLKKIERVVRWRNDHAPGKPVWLTEFGWDSTTKPADTEGAFKDWVGVTDVQQARYIVRAFLVLAEYDIERAYLFWFNDDDSPSIHGSSGLTRHYQPKPAFHAAAQLQRVLGDYQFVRAVVKNSGELYVYEFQNPNRPVGRIWAAWSPTGSEREATARLPRPPGRITRAEKMSLTPAVETATWSAKGDGIELPLGESPTYLWIDAER